MRAKGPLAAEARAEAAAEVEERDGEERAPGDEEGLERFGAGAIAQGLEGAGEGAERPGVLDDVASAASHEAARLFA